MTRPDPLREMAEKLQNFCQLAWSLNYQTTDGRPNKEHCIEQIIKALRTAHRQGKVDDGCAMCGSVRFLAYDRDALNERLKKLLITCAKGTAQGEFDINWFLDSIHDEIRLIAKGVEKKAYKQGQESMRERAAKVCDKQAECHKLGDSTWKALAESYAAMIRALEPETGGKP